MFCVNRVKPSVKAVCKRMARYIFCIWYASKSTPNASPNVNIHADHACIGAIFDAFLQQFACHPVVSRYPVPPSPKDFSDQHKECKKDISIFINFIHNNFHQSKTLYLNLLTSNIFCFSSTCPSRRIAARMLLKRDTMSE